MRTNYHYKQKYNVRTQIASSKTFFKWKIKNLVLKILKLNFALVWVWLYVLENVSLWNLEASDYKLGTRNRTERFLGIHETEIKIHK